MKKYLLIATLAIPTFLSGCVISVNDDGDGGYHTSWENREKKNRRLIADLEPQLTYQDVKQRFGVADFNELVKKGDDQFQILFYRTQRKDSDGITTKDECTPLVLKNGELIGWGDSAYQYL